jgi:membrane protease subunit (stomatin/prohibitin family)
VALLGREFIAVPDDKKQQIVYKWPDHNIRKYTRAIVNADEMAMFVNTGQVVATMGPGRHQIDADEIPGLGVLIDHVIGANVYKAELYFVGTREFTGNMFGGRIDDVQDPQTGMIVTLRVFGDYSMQVKDPAALITNLVGTVDVTDNQAITGWMGDQLLKVMRTHMTVQIVRNGWPILGLSAFTPDIEEEVKAKGNEQLAPYGVAIIRMGNFDINLSEEDEKQLKTLAKDTAYSRLAGSFQQYASGEMALGAGQGMAQGGGAVGGAFLAAGLGVGGQAAAPAQPGPPPPPGPGFAGGGAGFAGPSTPTAPTTNCPSCDAANAAGAKFCASCGTSLSPPVAACPSCGSENSPAAKFCSSCGTAMVAAPAHCTSCGAELAAGARFCPECGTSTGPAASGGTSPPPAPAPGQ